MIIHTEFLKICLSLPKMHKKCILCVYCCTGFFNYIYLSPGLHVFTISNFVSHTYRFDCALLKAFKQKIQQSAKLSGLKGSEWAISLQEMRAQLYMYCGTFLIRLAKEVGHWINVSVKGATCRL